MSKYHHGNQVLFVVAIISSLFLSATVFANDYKKAVDATNSGNYDVAASIWKKLAQQGNPVAQYNLAVFYKEGYGVDSDNSESKRWYKAAAQHRLVQATARIDNSSIKPAEKVAVASTGSSIVARSDPVGWVLSQNPRHFTLQLASSRSEKRIKKYYEENEMQGKGGYYKKLQDGETWFFLIYGSFDSTISASNEIEQLPKEIRKWSPWVRRLGNIQKVINQNGV